MALDSPLDLLGAVADMVSGCRRLLYVKLLVMAAAPPL